MSILLVVDDELRYRVLPTLKMPDSEVIAAKGLDGAQELFDETVTLVLLDQDLGAGNPKGHKVAEWIRGTGSGVVIIAYSSSTLSTDRVLFEVGGADGFLPKSNFSAAAPYLEKLAGGHRLPKGQTFVEVYNPRISE